MKRVSLYSSSGRGRGERSVGPDRGPGSPDPSQDRSAVPPEPSARARRLEDRLLGIYRRNERWALFSIGAGVALAALFATGRVGPGLPELTQRDIDQAVLHTLENLPDGPADEAVAFATIRPSVVRVRQLGPRADGEDDVELDAGTGVVIVDDGTILTNLHVIAGAERIEVVFADGSTSPAEVISVTPEQDLAVIRASVLPDDLVPATLRSTSDLNVGDRVVAVGFPFGIGPSLSSGVVSGLRREYRTPEGERILSDLIQFDAAVNPGNSGGPLVTMDGRVVGIVTAILNPSNQRVFIGIGFAVPIETAAAAAGRSPF